MTVTRRGPRSGRPTGAIAALLALAALVAGAAPAGGQEGGAVLHRLFLTDGSALVSFGEFSRVADRVVFSMPVGPPGPSGASALELVSIPASAVDWDRTDRYAASARAQHYAATRGDAEFTEVSGRVAWALNEIALSADPARRLQLAEQARKTLADWSRGSLGYRAKEAADLASLLDEIISGLRAAAGEHRFELSFVAGVEAPPPVPMLPPPTLRDSIEQTLAVARLTGDPTSRIDLLRQAMRLLDGSEATLPAAWVVRARVRAIGELAAELRVEQAYSSLSASTLSTAGALARRADVRAIEGLIQKTLAADDALGRLRPDAISALLSALESRLDQARRLRLARDTWRLRAPQYREYQRAVTRSLGRLDRIKAPLEDIRRLSGPDAAVLARAVRRVDDAARALSRVKPPDDLKPVHGLFASALQLARSACDVRGRAVETADIGVAWEASSAAAGALILLRRASDDLDRFLALPQLP
jgi:hypothetical protein